MAPITVSIRSRSDKTLADIEIDSEATVATLKAKFAERHRKWYVARQRFTLPPKVGDKKGEPVKDDSTLASYGLKSGSVLYFKDLGPQIGYSTVFFWEYFGPMVVYPLFLLLPQVFYPGYKVVPLLERPMVQQIACMYWVLHYAKRIYETFYVHRFGHATMPIFNLFKNCSYYWGFAAYVAYFVNHPLYTPPPEQQSFVCFMAALGCQLANLRCHDILANLRKPGEKGYAIPRGFLFNWITCANYSTEIWGWTLFSVGTQSLAALLFTAAGAYQMAVWAGQKHKRLLKLFDGKEGRLKYPRRWIMLPPFY